MRYGYAWEKLFATVQALAEGSGSIQDRLCNAWVSSAIRLQGANPSHLPPDLQPEFDAIHDALTRVKNPDPGYIRATCDVLTDEEASEFAGRIVSLFNGVAEAYFRDLGRAGIK